MHEHLALLVIALLILGYGYFSKLLAKFNISGPMVFTTLGIILSPLFLGNTPLKFTAHSVQVVAEIALILVLFSDASSLNIRRLKSEWGLPTRLLFVALPLSIIFSFFIAKYFFPNTEVLYILLLAIILAPTDAALGKVVVIDKSIPQRVRDTINVESGLNDGIVFPILLTVLTIIASKSSNGSDGWFLYIVQQISIGALAGAFIGLLGAKVAEYSMKRGWIEHQYINLTTIALAILSFYFAENMHGNGYIAAFFAGLFLGNANKLLKESISEFAESEGELLVMVSFIVFGLVFVPTMLPYINMNVFIYAILSLTVLRMVPIVISYGFLKIGLTTRLFIGWFGPRGIASILYILIATEKLGGINGWEEVFATASLTILLSIFLHGISAKPLAYWYSQYAKRRR